MPQNDVSTLVGTQFIGYITPQGMTRSWRAAPMYTLKCVPTILPLLFGLALLFCTALNAEALEAFIPSETINGVFIGKYVEHYVDPTKQLTLADVRSETYQSQFLPVNRDTLDFGMSEAAHWIHLTVNNPTNVEIKWILQAEHPLLNHIEVYEIGHNSEMKFHEGGTQIPFSRRDIAYRKNAFSMTTPQGSSEIYIKFWPKYRGVANCSLTAWGNNDFLAKNGIDILLLGLYFGALLVMCLYNLFIYFSVRDTVYLPYVAYIAVAGLAYFALNGLGFQYLYPTSTYWGLHGSVLYALSSFTLAILFSRSFLNTKSLVPTVDKILLAAATFCMFAGIMTLVEAKSYFYAINMGYLVSLLFPPLLLLIGVWSLKAGNRQARFYVGAWTVYFLGVMLYFLKDFGVLPYSFVTAYSMQIGTLADVLLLSFALADRIKILRAEKEAAEAKTMDILVKSNEELEAQVAGRTSMLQESENRYRSLVETCPEPIVIHSEGIALYANQACLTIIGAQSLEQFVGKEIMDFVHTETRPQILKNAELLISGQATRFIGVDEKYLRLDGSVFEAEVSSSMTVYKDKPAFQAFFRDVTRRKTAERELNRLKDEAEEATRMKDKFVSLVTHDLKSPLASLTLGLEMLHNNGADIPPARRQFIGKMAIHSRELLNMAGRLLDISRLQAGGIIPQKRFFNCRLFAASQIALYQTTATQKEIAIVNDLPNTMKMYADPDLFGECVKNVLSNAIKFCDKGDTITFLNPPEMPSTIAVKDNGPGIAPEKMPLLFTAEMKTRSLGTAGEKGTGIGLPHAKELMEAHGGGISVESAPGKGSTFFLTLPPTFNVTVLVVDDQEVVRMAIKEHCADVFPGILEAGNGAEALEIIKNVTPHLIITDINMPVMNGLEFIQQIRNDSMARRVPIIAMTSDESWPTPNGMDIRSYCLHIGADDFVNKPVAANDLVPRISRLLSATREIP